MKRWAFSASLAALLVAAPSAGQDAPKSLLPDVFGAPPAEAPPPRPQEPSPEGPAAPPPGQPDVPALTPPPAIVPSGPDPFAAPSAARSLDVVGPLPARLGGYGMRAFAESNGAFVTELAKRIDPPLASRWGHIVLRRALLSRVPTPRGVRPADWVAARASLLLRMGEVDGAKLLVDSLPVDRYTPQLYGVASQVHLAAADVPALCPLAPSARGFSKAPFWELANAICAGLEGDDFTAAAQFDRIRARRAASTIDIVLGERVATVLTGEGRGANVEWDDIKRLDPYRFGLASAAGVEIPADLLQNPGVALTGWMMRSANGSFARRAAVAPRAASFGIASAGEIAAISAAEIAALDPDATADARVEDMRAAFAGRTNAERVAAMQRLWQAGVSERDRYGRIIATAEAAARISPDAGEIESAGLLIESMLSAGYVRQALGWWRVLAEAPEDDRLSAWPYLALADRSGTIPVSTGLAGDWHRIVKARGGNADRKAAMFGAAMDALGKSGNWRGFAEDYGYVPLTNSYTRKLLEAATARRRGEVAVLVGIGLQSDWSRVSPGQLAAIVGGLDRAGFRTEARLLAIEAVTRS